MNFFKGLFSAGDENASMGKMAFWLAFVLALVFWGLGRDIVSTHENILVGILAYTLGGKAAWSVSQFAGKGNGNDK